MAKRKDRVVVDTNLWISYLLNSRLIQLDEIVSDGKTKLLFSQELLDEFIEVASRPKLKRYFSQQDLEDLISHIGSFAEFVVVNSSVTVCRDPKDDFLLALAKDGKATHIITGDKDLLSLSKFEKTVIVTVQDYISSR